MDLGGVTMYTYIYICIYIHLFAALPGKLARSWEGWQVRCSGEREVSDSWIRRGSLDRNTVASLNLASRSRFVGNSCVWCFG